VFGLTEGPPLHDPLAVAAAILPDLFEDDSGSRYAVSVVTEGEHGDSAHIRSGSSQCGRTVAKLLPPGTPGVRIPKKMQVAELWHLIDMCLARAESIACSSI
jgi:uridine nucleosidase